jgi:D-inositol-3-phosphate glycosyltransferase
VETLAVLSMHTSPLAQAGTGDGGGMNVYIRELCAGLARRGVRCEVFTRAEDPAQPAVVRVEPGFRVHHVPAGPVAPVPKEDLLALVPAWTAGVSVVLDRLEAGGCRVDAVHANYWLSGVAGHRLKHERQIPLVSTFHTLDRVKADPSPVERALSAPRQQAELDTVGCSDLLLASCEVEAEQLVGLYGADRARIEIVAPGVDHAIFGPGDRRQARRAIGWPIEDPLVLFVGRVQPLKGPSVAVEAFGVAVHAPLPAPRAASVGLGAPVGVGAAGAVPGVGVGVALSGARPAPGAERLGRASLMIIGGPSGAQGSDELAAVRRGVDRNLLAGRVHLVAPQRHEVLSTSYRAADVVVVPSRSESFGLVALEASACGIPVVASAVGGLTTLVDHGRTGYLVEGRDPALFAHHLRHLIAEPAQAASLGRAAAARAGAYTWTAAAARLEERMAYVISRQLVACG